MIARRRRFREHLQRSGNLSNYNVSYDLPKRNGTRGHCSKRDIEILPTIFDKNDPSPVRDHSEIRNVEQITRTKNEHSYPRWCVIMGKLNNGPFDILYSLRIIKSAEKSQSEVKLHMARKANTPISLVIDPAISISAESPKFQFSDRDFPQETDSALSVANDPGLPHLKMH